MHQPGVEHSWICILSIIALIFYFKGSYKFYKNQSGFFLWFGLGVFSDILMALVASTKIMPVLLPNEGIPYTSILFMLHITMSTIGMVGYILVFLIIAIRGVNQPYPLLRVISYQILLPTWIVGVAIAIFNFLSKIVFQINLFNHI